MQRSNMILNLAQIFICAAPPVAYLCQQQLIELGLCSFNPAGPDRFTPGKGLNQHVKPRNCPAVSQTGNLTQGGVGP